MVRIVSDSSTQYTIAEGRALGIAITPLLVTIAGKSYREYEEISSREFLDIIAQGNIPTSSQPSVGEVIANYEALAGNEIINISMAAGLSGTYESAVLAAGQAKNAADITVVNSRTLCGPHRYIVTRAASMAGNGATSAEILDMLERASASTKSFLIPSDFDYLRRGGRINERAGKVMGALKIMPVLVETEDGRKLDLAGIHRSKKLLLKSLSSAFSSHGLGDGDGWLITVSHADYLERAQMIRDHLGTAFPRVKLEVRELGPVFITQGGPRCVSVQAVRKV